MYILSPSPVDKFQGVVALPAGLTEKATVAGAGGGAGGGAGAAAAAAACVAITCVAAAVTACSTSDLIASESMVTSDIPALVLLVLILLVA